jgi:hypothetical protein
MICFVNTAENWSDELYIGLEIIALAVCDG